MRRQSASQHLSEARRIAKAHGMFVIEKGADYILYRSTPTGNVRIGRRRSPADFKRFVASVAKAH